MIYFNEEFFYDLNDLVNRGLDIDSLLEENKDFTITYKECDLQPIGILDGEVIAECAFDDDRFSEEDYDDKKKIAKILDDNVDWAKINELLPKFWYPNPIKKVVVSKIELIEEID